MSENVIVKVKQQMTCFIVKMSESADIHFVEQITASNKLFNETKMCLTSVGNICSLLSFSLAKRKEWQSILINLERADH